MARTTPTKKTATKKAAGGEGIDRQALFNQALADVTKKYGAESARRLGDTPIEKVDTFSTTSLSLDVALGVGGLPAGRIIEIYGPESSGKTTLTLHAIASAQAKGGNAVFVDAEHALDPEYAANLGVDVENLVISQPDNGEEALDVAEAFVSSGAVDLVVVDSVAALTPKAELEGDMDKQNVGLQARMMSKGLRKMTAAANKNKCTVIFINQLREKIGVFFGCFNYSTRVTLADGTQEKIGKLVNEKREGVEVLSYNADTGQVEPRRIVNYFDNGKADYFLQFTVDAATPNGKSQFAATPNHQISTPDGWVDASALKVGDMVLSRQKQYLNDDQRDLVMALLLGDGGLSYNRSKKGTRIRLGHGTKQSEYLLWKAGLLAGLPYSSHVTDRASFIDFKAIPELNSMREEVYSKSGKVFSEDFIERMSPMHWAIWYMDDGSLSVRSKGAQKRTKGGSGRIEVCVDAMSHDTQARILKALNGMGINATLRTGGSRGQNIIVFDRKATDEFLKMVAPYIHESMEYKLLPGMRGGVKADVPVTVITPKDTVAPAPIVDIQIKPETRSMQRFDIEVEGNHNYFVDGTLVHNSPETTTGGKALKFYASVRLDIRRIETLKDGANSVGNRTRVKVVKNKVAPPFKQAEFDIIYGEGISREGGILDAAVEHGLMRKAGAWFSSLDGEQLGQGKENTRQYLKDNPDYTNDLERQLLELLLPKPTVKDEGEDEATDEFVDEDDTTVV